MKVPNLFRYATKELSQDAIICWLIDCSANDHDPELRQLGERFVEALLSQKQKYHLDAGVSNLEILQQQRNIDVLVRINNRHVLLIEDKTDSKPHGDQLARYRKSVLSGKTGLGNVAEEDLFAIYIKTGNQSLTEKRQIEKETGYKVFDRADFIKVLSGYNGNNAIVKDFVNHLESIERQTQSFHNWRKSDSKGDRHWHDWEGLYLELERHLLSTALDRFSNGWGYVPNRSGGFLGFWWKPTEIMEEHCAYLQLEQEKLCFKIWTKESSPDMQNELKWEWNKRITRQHERVSKPKVMRRGYTMTVAVHLDGWIRYHNEGAFDLDGTIARLREAERILLAAVRQL